MTMTDKKNPDYKYSEHLLYNSDGEVRNPKCDRCKQYQGYIYTETTIRFVCLKCYKIEIVKKEE